PLKALLEVAHDRVPIAAAHAHGHIEVARDTVVSYEVEGGQDAHISHIPQADVASIRCIEEQLAHTGEAVLEIGRADHYHTVYLLVLKEAASYNACHQCGCQPTDIAWLESVALCLVEVDLDLYLRHIHLGLCAHICNPVDLRYSLPHLLSHRAEAVELVAVDPDNDIVAR